MLHLALALILPTSLGLPIQEAREPRPQIQPPVDAPAQDVPDATAAETKFATAQLEQIVAPIALYPDVLLSQVLMASTYPLEIVEAHRFMQANPKLAGDKLEAALKEKDWDPSVKSMCGFPDLLARMNDNLDWMRDLGDAFLAQEAELMDAVQQMRRTAFDAGTLKSTKEQTVAEQDDHIVIAPASSEVIYVPVYYPTYVYGGWGYPWWYYPRLYVGPPTGGPYFYYSVGFGWGPWSPWMWGRCNWHRGHSHVDVDVHVHNTFVTRTSSQPRNIIVAPRDGRDGRDARDARDGKVIDGRDGGRTAWKHDPAHRRGVNYRDSATRQRVQPRPPSDDLRGRTRPPRADPQPPRADPRPPRPRGDEVTPTPPRPPSNPPRPNPPKPRPRDDATRALDGARNPMLDRAASERGYRSLRPYWQRNGVRAQPPRANPPRTNSPRTNPPRPRGGS